MLKTVFTTFLRSSFPFWFFPEIWSSEAKYLLVQSHGSVSLTKHFQMLTWNFKGNFRHEHISTLLFLFLCHSTICTLCCMNLFSTVYFLLEMAEWKGPKDFLWLFFFIAILTFVVLALQSIVKTPGKWLKKFLAIANCWASWENLKWKQRHRKRQSKAGKRFLVIGCIMHIKVTIKSPNNCSKNCSSFYKSVSWRPGGDKKPWSEMHKTHQKWNE